MITAETLARIAGRPAAQVQDWVSPLTVAMIEFDITTPARAAAFLAQITHESAGFALLLENLNYSAEALRRIWPSRFSPEEAQAYARQPERIANRVYANRMGNGAEETGDGWRYRGRGPIQLTGRSNYRLCGDGLRLDLVGCPDQLLQPAVGARAAAWFWAVNGIHAYADRGDFDGVCDKVNIGRKTVKEGDAHGYADRHRRWEIAKELLGKGPLFQLPQPFGAMP